jgi:hypothetical protein
MSGINIATVAEIIEGQPILRFAGEELNSPKAYKYFTSYAPQAGDRVLVINDVIIGGWRVCDD